MSVWDDLGDVASDIGDGIVDVAEGAVALAVDALEAAGGAIGDAFGAAADAAGATLGGIGDVLSTAADVMDEVGILDLGEVLLVAMDDVVFDTVDFATAGLVDVDYDDGVFGANVGIDDVFGLSVTVSEEGFEYGYDVVVASFEVGYGADGFSVGAAAGMDWGPLPYVEGHMSLDEDGNVGIGGQIQAYLPTPAGLSGGELIGDYQETDEGFRASGSVTGGNYAPTGTYAMGGVHSSYEEDDEGYRFQVGVHGEVGQVGVGSVRASVDYVEGRQGDTSFEGVTVEAGADAFGASAEIEGSYTHLETPDGEVDVVTGGASAAVAGNTVGASGGVVSGPEGTRAFGEVEHNVDELGLATSGLELAGDALGVGGPSDLGLPDVGRAQEVLRGAPADLAGEAIAASGVDGMAQDAAREVAQQVAQEARDVAQEVAQQVAQEARDVAQEVAQETFDEVFASVPQTVQESAVEAVDDAG